MSQMTAPRTSARKTGRKKLPETFGVRQQRVDPLETMQEQLAQARESFKAQMREHYRTSPARRESTLSSLHQAFAMQNALAVVAPLRQNVSFTNIIRAASMGATMYALNPQFRDEVNRVAANSMDSLKETLRDSQKKLDELRLAGLRGKKLLHEQTKANFNSASLDERIAIMEQRVRGRVPYTAEAVGYAHMALDEELYETLRSEDSTPEFRAEKLGEHEAMVRELYRMGQEDGLTVGQMDEAYRDQVHNVISHHPAAATLWMETGMDGVYAAADGSLRNDGGLKVVQGSPRVRVMMSEERHTEYISDMMYVDLAQAQNPRDFNERMMGYAVAWASTSSTLGDTVLASAQGETARRVLRGRINLQCMADDGLDIDAQKQAYASALHHTLDSIEERRPELAQHWRAVCGEQWKEEVLKLVHEPKHFTQHFERVTEHTAHAERTGPEPEPARVYDSISGRSTPYHPVAVYRADDVVEGELIDDDEMEL